MALEGVRHLVEALADRYAIGRELGRGGMATVYLAHDLRHDRDVALKVLRPELAAILGRERFLAEIRLTAKLDHPHILTLLDSGEVTTGHPERSEGPRTLLWYTLPYIRGESLRQRLQRERQLKVADALSIARHVAAALDYAHRQGVIHRDVKPENILLHEGEAMLADFGIALAIREAGGERLTETGLGVGTPQYMSPEQATAERQLDARSDVYSLGAVLYEMLAGEPPFTGATGQAVIAKLMTTPPVRLRTVRDTVPEGVDQAVAKALAKLPADRFDTPAELATALSVEAEPTLRRLPRSRSIGITPGIAAGVVILGLGALWLARSRPEPPMAPVALRRFTLSGTAGQPALSPDGRRVAYTVSSRSLAVQPLDGGEPVLLVPAARGILEPRWSRDGSVILFMMYRDSLVLMGTWMIRSDGGAARQVMDDQDAYDAGPDSTTAIRYNRPDHSLEVVQLTNGRIRDRFPLPATVSGVNQFGGVSWSPDGRLVALGAGSVWVLKLSDSSVTLVTPEGTNPRWDPAGKALFFLAGPSGGKALWQVGINPATGRPRGRPALVVSLPRARQVDVGPAGRMVVEEVSSTVVAQVMSVPRRPGPVEHVRTLNTGTADVSQVSLSGDGQYLALARYLAGDQMAVDLVTLAGGETRTLPPQTASQTAPRWAPDGRQLTVMRSDSGGQYFATLVSRSDGSARRLSSRPAITRADWSGDGSKVSFLTSRREIVIVDLAGLTESTLAAPDSLSQFWPTHLLSPHGDQLIVNTIHRPTDWTELWLVDLATRQWRRVTAPFGNNVPLRWLPDGTIYVANYRALMGEWGEELGELWTIRIDGGPAHFVADLPDGCRLPSISADGRLVACDIHRDVSDLLVATDSAAGRP